MEIISRRKLLLFMLLSLFLCMSKNSFSQTATSIGNGNWTNPLTWSCTCIPLPGYTVIINTNVTLNTSIAYTTGSITINNGAELIEDTPTRDIWVNGGSLINNGALNIRYLWTQTGTFSNTGTITARSILSNVNFTNTGNIQNVDSIYTTATVINNGNFLNIDSITTDGSFTNNGICTFNQFTNTGTYTNNNQLTFTDITNTGTFTNTDSVTAMNSCWNLGIWNNPANSYFLLNKGFLNDDITLHDAVLTNNGKMIVLDSWYNRDTVKGSSSGIFMVSDSSLNFGWMLGSFDFCDLTPPTSAPFIDYNLNFISVDITWCNVTSMDKSVNESFIHIFPNPAQYEINIQSSMNLEEAEFTIFNSLGQTVKRISTVDTHKITVFDKEFSNGLYFLWLKNHNKQLTAKFIIDK